MTTTDIDHLMTLKTLTPEKSEQQLVNRILLQQMLQNALQVNNPSKAWFADIIRRQMGILATIAQKQQEQGIDIPAEVRAILDPKALMRKGKKCLRVSKGGKGTKTPKGLVDASCVRNDQWVYNKLNDQIYMIDGSGKRKKWVTVGGLPETIKDAFRTEHINRGGKLTPTMMQDLTGRTAGGLRPRVKPDEEGGEAEADDDEIGLGSPPVVDETAAADLTSPVSASPAATTSDSSLYF